MLRKHDFNENVKTAEDQHKISNVFKTDKDGYLYLSRK